jgi:hypothetical protein
MICSNKSIPFLHMEFVFFEELDEKVRKRWREEGKEKR